MPTYDYECTHCGHQFEVFQKITEAALNKSPKCSHNLRRLIGSGSGIIFSRKYSQRTESGSRCCHWESVASGRGQDSIQQIIARKRLPKQIINQTKPALKLKMAVNVASLNKIPLSTWQK